MVISKIPAINLVAIDPGETTGVVEIKKGNLHDCYCISMDQIMRESIPGTGIVGRWCKYDRWVIEEFRVYPSLPPMDPVLTARLIGVLEAVALWARIGITFQSASFVRQFSTDDWLRELGWWPGLAGQNRHIKDAARHAACYLLRMRGK